MFGLDSERLRVRPWNDDDRAAFQAITADPDVNRFIHGGKPYSDDEVIAYFARQAKQLSDHDLCMGAVVEKSSDRVVGIAGVQPLGTTADMEIGWIFSRETWGRGYATEIGQAAMRYVFDTMGRNRVVAIIDPENEASKRVAARLGMDYEGRVTGADIGYRFPEIVVDLFARSR